MQWTGQDFEDGGRFVFDKRQWLKLILRAIEYIENIIDIIIIDI